MIYKKMINAILITIVTIFALQAQGALAKEKVILKYALYSKGIKIVEIDYDLLLDGDHYQASRHIESVGIASWFADINLDEKVEGKIDDEQLQPESFATKATGSRNHHVKAKWNEKKEVTYSLLSGFTLSEQTHEEIEQAVALPQKIHVMEEVSEQFAYSFVDKDDVCKGKLRIFTGKRVFDHDHQYLGYYKLRPSSIREYSGNGFICKRTKINVAGYGKERNGKKDTRNPHDKIWIGEIKVDGRDLRIIVQLEQQNSRLGRVVGYLVSMKRVPLG